MREEISRRLVPRACIEGWHRVGPQSSLSRRATSNGGALNDAAGKLGRRICWEYIRQATFEAALAQKLNLILAAVVVPGMLLAGSGSLVGFAFGQLMVLVPMMLYLGVYPSLLPYLFPSKIRCSGFSLSYSLSVAIVGGTAPMAATWLLQEQGWSQGPAWYCVIWAIPALLALRHIGSYCVDE